MSTVSKPIELLDLVWAGANKATGHSWERLNHSMWNAVVMAIGSGMQFDEGDFEHIFGHYDSSRWIGEGSERFYRMAVCVGNLSAAASFERAMKREPIIADNVRAHGGGDFSGYLHMGGDGPWDRQRLAVGFQFTWDGQDVIVTSFGKEGDETCVVACAHDDGAKHRGKVTKRYRVTRADIIAGRKAARPPRPRKAIGDGKNAVIAWHFRNEDGLTHRLKRAEQVGRIYSVSGRVVACGNGLHGSVGALDALSHYTGPGEAAIVCRTRHSGVIDDRGDKIASQYREVLWQADCRAALKKYNESEKPLNLHELNALFESLMLEIAPAEQRATTTEAS